MSNNKSMRDIIDGILKLDGKAVVNLEEPSPSDLERIYSAYLAKCEEADNLKNILEKITIEGITEVNQTRKENAELRALVKKVDSYIVRLTEVEFREWRSAKAEVGL